MALAPQITELLKKVQSGERDAADAIVEHFWNMARREAHKNLSKAIRRFKSGSDIANAALRSALSYLGNPKAVVRNRDDFEDLVLDIVRKHSKDAGRRATAKKRSIGRQRGLPDEDVIAGRTELVDDLAMANELGRRIEAILMEEPDDGRLAISRMGIIGHMEPSQIREELSSSAKGRDVPALRTIQIYIQEAKDRVALALREEYGELRQPKKKKGLGKVAKAGSKLRRGTASAKKVAKNSTSKRRSK